MSSYVAIKIAGYYLVLEAQFFEVLFLVSVVLFLISFTIKSILSLSKMSKKYIHVTSQSKVTLALPSITSPCQYPSEWFLANPNKKPTLSVGFDRKETELDKVVYQGIRTNELSLSHVKAFLYKYFCQITERLTSDWVSYGVRIGSKDDEVSPFSLLDVTHLELALDNRNITSTFKDSDRDWMAMLLLAPARVTNLKEENNYADKVKEKIVAQMKTLGAKDIIFPSKDVYEGWADNEAYMKIAASVDMFFMKFPSHHLSKMRICTLSTRAKDCAGILALGHITKVLSLTQESDFLDWVFTEDIAKELVKMMKSDTDREEMLDAHSYFHYQSDLKLVTKSHFSGSQNPNLFVAVHCIGSLLGSKRSMNSRMWSEANMTSNKTYAKVIAYVFSQCVDFTKAFTEDGGNVNSEEVVTRPGDEPLELDATGWYNHFDIKKFKLDKHINEYIKARTDAIKDARDGSIGQYVKTNFRN